MTRTFKAMFKLVVGRSNSLAPTGVIPLKG
jgi:hypothetical protein